MNLTFMGDSKTAGFPFQSELLASINANYSPHQLATSNWTTANLNSAATAWLAAATDTPDFVLINIGINDAAVGTSQAVFESEMGALLDKIHARWASTQILLMLVWGRGYEVGCDVIDDTWIPSVLSTRGSFASVGPDERVFLKGSDNGFTNTNDGVHANAAGNHETALAWKAALGL